MTGLSRAKAGERNSHPQFQLPAESTMVDEDGGQGSACRHRKAGGTHFRLQIWTRGFIFGMPNVSRRESVRAALAFSATMQIWAQKMPFRGRETCAATVVPTARPTPSHSAGAKSAAANCILTGKAHQRGCRTSRECHQDRRRAAASDREVRPWRKSMSKGASGREAQQFVVVMKVCSECGITHCQTEAHVGSNDGNTIRPDDRGH